MSLQEIPRDQWSVFFDSFSQKHAGWLVTLEIGAPGQKIGSPQRGAQVEAREVSLQAIAADLKGAGEDKITITTGKDRGERLTHIISSPLRIVLETTNEGADKALQIQSARGDVTFVRFRSAVLPEIVDGIAPL
ncbi:MAG TPA: DUF5335 family protein [Acidobacteriota bacterium]|jgi:hypothetical protein